MGEVSEEPGGGGASPNTIKKARVKKADVIETLLMRPPSIGVPFGGLACGLVSLVLGFALPREAAGQTPTDVSVPVRPASLARLSGRVMGPEEMPVPGARIEVSMINADVGVEELGACRGSIVRRSWMAVADSAGRFDVVLEVGPGPSFRGCLHLRINPPPGSGLDAGVASGLAVLVIAGADDAQRAEVEVSLERQRTVSVKRRVLLGAVAGAVVGYAAGWGIDVNQGEPALVGGSSTPEYYYRVRSTVIGAAVGALVGWFASR